MKETPEGQAANRDLRKGTKRPEHGPWPVANKDQVAAKKKEMAKKMVVGNETHQKYSERMKHHGNLDEMRKKKSWQREY